MSGIQITQNLWSSGISILLCIAFEIWIYFLVLLAASYLRKSDSWVRSLIPVTSSATHNGHRVTTCTAVIAAKLCLEQDSLPDSIPLHADFEYIVFFLLEQGKRVQLTRPFGAFLGVREEIWIHTFPKVWKWM